MKKRGFNLEDTHLVDAERISRLVAVLTLTLCWCYKVGQWQDQKKPIRLKTHQRRAQSVIRLGLDTLRRALLSGATQPVQLLTMIKLLFENPQNKSYAYG